MLRAYINIIFISGFYISSAQSFPVSRYYSEIKRLGQDPFRFVAQALQKQDLIIFDDALHNAYEPFVFYHQLINNRTIGGKINYLFLEVISTTAQPLLDSFLNNTVKDSSILCKVFQDDYTGLGWTYQTYLDLFNAVWEHNHQFPDAPGIRIMGVSPPIYWEALHTWQDYELFQNTLKSRDYYMYMEILEAMEGFKKNKKALFLCNTRHAYTNVKNSEGRPYWNTASFFQQRNSGKFISIRIHNLTLSLENKVPAHLGKRKSTDGLSEAVYKWVKMDQGHWDEAFASNHNQPVAISLHHSLFGSTRYIGNHMLNCAAGTTMADAYDALIFLAPLNNLHFSAQFSFIYTPAFKPEMERRLQLLKGNDYPAYLKENNAIDFNDYYQKIQRVIPVSINNYLQE